MPTAFFFLFVSTSSSFVQNNCELIQDEILKPMYTVKTILIFVLVQDGLIVPPMFTQGQSNTLCMTCGPHSVVPNNK